jgi:Tol biopolymer transport system component
LLGQPPIVAVNPSPANGATATAEAAYATAVAIATGTYTPTPQGAVTAIIVIPTPQPANVATAAAQIVTAVARDRLIGTVTPLPFNAVLATLTPGLEVATSTPRPSNAATVQALANYATAVAMTTGTFTPQPARPITPTFTPVATPVPLVVYQDFTVPTATPIPDSAPRQLSGKILFQSDRPSPAGLPPSDLWVYDPATRGVGYVTQPWVFNRAEAADRRTASGEGVQSLSVEADADNNFQLFLINNRTNQRTQLTEAKADSYDPAWRPGGQQFAFVSQESGNDEIYTMTPDGGNRRQLTVNQWEWDKHPSYSPDGSQIVFSSNRGTGRRQIWIMNADGSNQRLLFPSQFEDYAPVWVK